MIKIDDLKPGKYVLATSGGVDSMVLLDLLSQQDVELIIAHVDHGIRTDSQQDRKLVEKVAMSHNLWFEHCELQLGTKVSEAKARDARYEFLRQTCKKYNALALITAHHQDDLIETAIINLLRGTGRKGLSSLQSTSQTLRPLLNTTKAEIIDYALRHELLWNEDSTNHNQKFLRNYVRHSIMTKLTIEQRKDLLTYIVRQNKLNKEIDNLFNLIMHEYDLPQGNSPIPRYLLIMLPDQIAYELTQLIVKKSTGNTVEKSQALHALHFAKTAAVGKFFDLNKKWALTIKKHGQIIVVPKQAC